MDRPFAITLDVGTSLVNHTAHGGPCGRNMCTGCRRAIMHVRPARISRAGCLMRKTATTKPHGAR